MTKDELREAKRNLTSVYATEDGTMETAFHGIVVQIGFHESGRDDLAVIEGHGGRCWFPFGAIRLHPREQRAVEVRLSSGEGEI